jgi:hypothetical protein
VGEGIDLLTLKKAKRYTDNQLAQYASPEEINSAVSAAEAKIVDVESRFTTLTTEQQQDAEVIDARNGESSLKARLDKTYGEFLAIKDNFRVKDNETVELGQELLTSSGWTTDGWTGDFDTGFEHVVGQTTPLKYPLPDSAGKLFVMQLTLSPAAVIDNGQSDFWVRIGGSELFETYKGAGASVIYRFGIRAIDDSGLEIIPWANYEGVITNISVREIINGKPPTLKIRDDVIGENVLEIRAGEPSSKNVYIGLGAGLMDDFGYRNVGVGESALENNVSGFWNTSIGSNTLKNNINGTRNIAIGHNAMQNNTSGQRNIAIGTFAQTRTTTGAYNIAMGADALWHNQTGNYNIAIGITALGDAVNGENNIGIGQYALAKSEGHDNIGIGKWAGMKTTNGEYNLFIGERSGYQNVNGSNNVGVGKFALHNNVASGNVAVGVGALEGNTSGTQNVGIGTNAGRGNGVISPINRCVLIGSGAGARLQEGGDSNIMIGTNAGLYSTTGSGNILIGDSAQTPSITDSNKLNIGNCIMGDLSSQMIGFGVTNPEASLHLRAGTANRLPLIIEPGALKSVTRVGGIEFDGSFLYCTLQDGTRKKLAFVEEV